MISERPRECIDPPNGGRHRIGLLALYHVFFPNGLATLAQQREPTPGEIAAGCGACGTCGGVMIAVPIAIIALSIVLLVWVARDAKARAIDNAVLWMIVVMITNVVGLIIYLSSRPQGKLVKCAHCENLRLQASAKCPHCGND